MISLFKVNPKTKTDTQLWALYSKSLEKWRRSGNNIFGPVYEQLTAFSEELDKRNIDKDLALTEEGRSRWEGRPMDIGKCKIRPELKQARELFDRFSNVVSLDSHPLVERVRDLSLLPASKEEIRRAIILLLQEDTKKHSCEYLKDQYLSLSEFQDGVGDDPIVTEVYEPFDDDDPSIPPELEFFSPSDNATAWQRIIHDEFEVLREELIGAGFEEREE